MKKTLFLILISSIISLRAEEPSKEKIEKEIGRPESYDHFPPEIFHGISTPKEIKKIEVHGHRGCRAVMPENTLAAFNEALKVEADVLEMDIGVTKDNVIVISHDQSINPLICLGPEGKKLEKSIPIRSLTLKEIKQYDCGSIPNPKFSRQRQVPGEKIPTLEEVFQLVINSTYPAAKIVNFNIETKIVPGEPEMSPSHGEFAKLFVDTVNKYGMAKRTILQSFDYRTLKAGRKLNKDIRAAMLTSENLIDFVAAAKYADASIISPDCKWLTQDEINRMHENGIQVVPWTVNSEKAWQSMIEAGVDAIITDDPEALIAYLKSKKLR